jgi:septation ring formation regulator EzrA
MQNIEHLKSLIDAELEALIAEISELKKRVTELELNQLCASDRQLNKEVLGMWYHTPTKESPTPTCK